MNISLRYRSVAPYLDYTLRIFRRKSTSFGDDYEPTFRLPTSKLDQGHSCFVLEISVD